MPEKDVRCGSYMGVVMQLFVLEPGFTVPLGPKGVDK